MKLIVLLLTISLFNLSASVYSQNTLFSLDVENKPIKEILKIVENQSHFRFLYNDDFLGLDRQVSLNIKDSPVEDILNSLFDNQDLTYRVFENNLIVITPTSLTLKQISKITGIVTDGTTGDPLPGVNILVEGTANGVITDTYGKYTIDIPTSNAVLLFSFVGYNSEKVEVGNKTTIDLALVPDIKSLEEVVVVGYGTQKKENLSGAISTMSGKVLAKRAATNVESLLQGQLPGLQVIQGSGQPGAEAIHLQIRGMGSYGSSNAPLIIVDGIPSAMPTAENIESITVLKDAASASIYGSRAANGVILISTKKGKSGNANLEYSINVGIYQASKIPDVISNSAQYMELWNRAADHSGIIDRYSQADIDKYKNSNGDPRYPNTNWMDQIFKPSVVTNQSITASGGNSNTTYNLNFNYLSEPGVVQGFKFDRYTSRLNIETRITNKIQFGVNASFGYSDRKAVSDMIFIAAFCQAPTYGPYLLDGSGKYTDNAFPSVEYHTNTNPQLVLDNSSIKTTQMSFQLNPYMIFSFTDWLQWEIKGSFSSSSINAKEFSINGDTYSWFTNELINNRSISGIAQGLTATNINRISPMAYSTLNFHKKLGDHAIGALVGTQIEYNKEGNMMALRTEYSDAFYQEIDAGGLTGLQNGGSAFETSMLSYFGRLNYGYQGKYLFEFNIRADGSSRFAAGNRWGYFPSGSIAWRPLQEKFMPKINWINDVKFRASYGKLGNQDIDNYPYQTVMTSKGYGWERDPIYSFDNSSFQTGVIPAGLTNKKISWEETKIIDFGTDLNFFNNSLLVTFDWFTKKTTGILRKQQVPIEVGYPNATPYVNSGAMKNTGFEISAGYRGNIGQVNFGIDWNIQSYKNKVVSFGSDEIDPSSYSPSIIREGEPYKSYYMYIWDGIFQTQAEADASGQTNMPQAGDLKIKDIGGPQNTPDGKIDGYDKTIVEGRFPKFSSGLTLNASWKDFDFSAFFYGSYGQKIFVYAQGFEPFYQGSIPTKDWLNAWTPENHSTTMPAVYDAQHYNSTWTTYPNTWFLRDNSFTRLKNVTIGWTYDKNLLKRIGLKSLRIYFSGENLFTKTSYKGLDPERTGGGYYLTYPQNKIYSFGAIAMF